MLNVEREKEDGMISRELQYAEQRMQQKWHDFVMAEQRGAAAPVLERMYSAYMLAVEEFNRCSSVQEREQQPQAKPAKKPVSQQSRSGKKWAS
jgi:hypothetical protein